MLPFSTGVYSTPPPKSKKQNLLTEGQRRSGNEFNQLILEVDGSRLPARYEPRPRLRMPTPLIGPPCWVYSSARRKRAPQNGFNFLHLHDEGLGTASPLHVDQKWVIDRVGRRRVILPHSADQPSDSAPGTTEGWRRPSPIPGCEEVSPGNPSGLPPLAIESSPSVITCTGCHSIDLRWPPCS